jgi:hypothetical protein
MKMELKFKKLPDNLTVIKLEEDLIGEAGQFLVIKDGMPRVYDTSELLSLAFSDHNLKATVKGGRRTALPHEHKLRKPDSLSARILMAWTPDASGTFPGPITSKKVGEIVEIPDLKLVSGIIGSLMRGGSLAMEKQRAGVYKLYSVTSVGKKNIRRLMKGA